MKILPSRLLSVALSAAAICMVPAAAQADDIQIELQTRNSNFNAGPFSVGEDAGFHAVFRVDSSVVPTGSTPTWAGGLDNLTLTIVDENLGSFVATAQDGNYRQLRGSDDFLFGGWGGIYGGSISLLSVTNLAFSATPFVLESITFDFRGDSLFADDQTLPGTLSHAPPQTDFSFLDITLHFSNADSNVSNIQKSAIIRGAAFESVQISPVPEPATVSMMLAGMLVLATVARRRV